MMAPMDAKPELAFPAVPPPPEGDRLEPRARGLASLIAGLDSAVVYHRSQQLTAMVIVIGGRVVDAIAEGGGEVVKGIEVLDELSEVPVASMQVVGVEPRLARSLPVYWRAPGATREVVEGLVRPGRRGAVVVSSYTHGTGMVVFDEKGVIATFLDGEQREDALEAVLADPDAIVSARAEPQSADTGTETGPDRWRGTPTPEPVGAGPEDYSSPRSWVPPGQPRPTGYAHGYAGSTVYAPAPTSQQYPPPPPEDGADGNGALEQRKRAILDLLQRQLGRHAEAVAQPFRSATTTEALIDAADGLRGAQVRLVSSSTLQSLAQEAGSIARGDQPG
jgi:hypothetical protein